MLNMGADVKAVMADSSAMKSQGFYDPVNEKMIEPALTGISYSFTDDGFFEEAYYRSVSNRMSLLSSVLERRESPSLTLNINYSHQTRMPARADAISTRHL